MAAFTSESKGLDAPDTWVIDVTKITLDEEIGRGSFGTVHLGEYQREQVAIKKISSAANKEQEEAAVRALQREVKALTRVRHRNVIQLIGVCVAPPMLVMAYAEKKTLRHVLDNDDLSLTSRLDIVKGVSRGMYALHDEDILHLDLKPSNVLLNQDMVPWITDFGLSFAMSASMSAGSTKSGRGTLRYKAPESWRPDVVGGPLTHKPTDVYSFAMLMWETFTGAVPFAEKLDTAVIDLHKNVYFKSHYGGDGGESKGGDLDLRPSLDSVPENVRTILSACWEHDFVKRPNFQRVCERLDRLAAPEIQQEDRPMFNVDELASIVRPPYLIAVGHSSHQGYGKPVKIKSKEYPKRAFMTYTEPGEYGWSDEVKVIMNYIKKNQRLPPKISCGAHNSQGVHYPEADCELRLNTDTTNNYQFGFHDHNGAGTSAGWPMGVYLADGTTPITPGQFVSEAEMRKVGLEISAKGESGKITVRELFKLAASLNVDHVVGVGCKRWGDLDNVLYVDPAPNSLVFAAETVKKYPQYTTVVLKDGQHGRKDEYMNIDGSFDIKGEGPSTTVVNGGFAILKGKDRYVKSSTMTVRCPSALVSYMMLLLFSLFGSDVLVFRDFFFLNGGGC